MVPERKEREPKLENRSGTGMHFVVPFLAHLCQQIGGPENTVDTKKV